jgi:serine/threonine protein kinase
MRAGVRLQAPESGPDATASSGERERAGFRSGDIAFGCYRLERLLDGRGRVWLAGAPKSPVVLKLGLPLRLAHERQVLEACAHRHVVRALALHNEGPVAGLVLEYLPGGDLVSLAGGAVRHWLGPVRDLVAALGHVHAQGFVHRDIKARNVRFDESGRVRLIDFGSAALAGSPWTRGGTTAEAVAPARGTEPVAPADDVYALAALLHELLYGRPPGSGGQASARPGGDEAIERLVATSLDGRRAAAPTLRDFADGLKYLQQRHGFAL